MTTRHRTVSLLAALLTAALLAPLVFAAPAVAAPKIAVVDLQRVLLTSRAGKAAKAKFEAVQKKKRKQLKRTDSRLQAREKALLAERVALEKAVAGKGPAGLTPALKQKMTKFMPKLKAFQQKVVAFQKTQREMVKNLAAKEAQLLKPIEDKIRKVINKIAKEKGYTLVLSRVAVVYGQASADITGEVARRMNGK